MCHGAERGYGLQNSDRPDAHMILRGCAGLRLGVRIFGIVVPCYRTLFQLLEVIRRFVGVGARSGD
jgi:hypothetical protein